MKLKRKRKINDKSGKVFIKAIRILCWILIILAILAGIYILYENNKFLELYYYLSVKVPPIWNIILVFLENYWQYLAYFLGAIMLILLIKIIGKKIKNKKVKEDIVEVSKGNITAIDELYNLIKENKKIELSKVAKRLGFPEDKIISWCEILEKNNLIATEYPAFGSPIIKIKENETN